MEMTHRRTCLLCANFENSNEMYINMFSEEGKQMNLMEKYEKCLGQKVNSKLSHCLCSHCVNQLHVTYSFIVSGNEAHRKLKEMEEQMEANILKCEVQTIQDAQLHANNLQLSSANSPPNTKCEMPIIQDEDTPLHSNNSQLSSATSPPNTNENHPSDEDSNSFLSSYIAVGSQMAFIFAGKGDTEMVPKMYLVMVNAKWDSNCDETVLDSKLTRICADVKKRLNLTAEQKDYLQGLESPHLFKFSCVSCRCSFLLKEEMLSHFETLHPMEAEYCSICFEKVYSPEGTLTKDMQFVHKYHMNNDTSSQLTSDFEPEYIVIQLGEVTPFTLRIDASDIIENLKEGKKCINTDMKLKVVTVLRDFMMHLIKLKPPEKWKKVLCTICNKFIRTYNNTLNTYTNKFKEHAAMHEKGHIYDCCHCKKKLTSHSKYVLLNHIHSHHYGGTNLICAVCDDEYQKTGNNQPHMWIGYECEKCRKKFKTPEILRNHEETQHNPEKVNCDFCKREMFKHYIARHIKGVHLSKIANFSCDTCNQSFSTEALVKHHKERIHGSNVPCEVCGKMFSVTYIKAHLNLHKNKFVCKYCYMPFTSKDSLIAHEKGIHEGIRYYCTICNPRKQFQKEIYLKNHLKRHKDGEQLVQKHQVQCETCGAFLSNLEKLERHTARCRTHKRKKETTPRNRSHPCFDCLIRFTTQDSYRNHIEKYHPEGISTTVNRDKPANSFRYQCQYCEKTFAKKDFCHQHEATHRGERPYVCPICFKSFRYFSDRNTHRKRCRLQNEFKSQEMVS